MGGNGWRCRDDGWWPKETIPRPGESTSDQNSPRLWQDESLSALEDKLGCIVDDTRLRLQDRDGWWDASDGCFHIGFNVHLGWGSLLLLTPFAGKLCSLRDMGRGVATETQESHPQSFHNTQEKCSDDTQSWRDGYVWKAHDSWSQRSCFLWKIK